MREQLLHYCITKIIVYSRSTSYLIFVDRGKSENKHENINYNNTIQNSGIAMNFQDQIKLENGEQLKKLVGLKVEEVMVHGGGGGGADHLTCPSTYIRI